MLCHARLKDLAAALGECEIVDRCRCGSDTCGTFYLQLPASIAARLRRRSGKPIGDGALIRWLGNSRICIETFDPAVEASLRQFLP